MSSAFTDQSLKDRVGLADKAVLDVIERSPELFEFARASPFPPPEMLSWMT